MARPATHILRQYPSASNDHLFRASDGMLLATRGGASVTFGQDPGRTEQRLFLDETFAKAFLRTLADADIAERLGADYQASVDEQFGESKLVTAQNSVLRN